jgi:HEAT repeat protein
MKLYPERLNRDYESSDSNRRVQEAYERMLNPMLDEDATADALGTLKAIAKSSSGDVKKMADSMLKSYEKNKGFSKDQAKWIYNTSKAIFK